MSTSYRNSRYGKGTRRKTSVFSKIAPVLATGLGFIAFTLLVPSNSTKKVEARIFTQGLAIKIDRTSPAYAALEDTLSSDTQSMAEILEERAVAALPVVALSSGDRSVEPVALKIVRDNRRETSLLAQARVERAQKIEQSSDVVNHPVQTISAQDLAKLFAPIINSKKLPDVGATPPQRMPTILASNGREPASRDASSPRPRGFDGERASSASFTEALDNKNEDIHQLIISGPLQFSGGIAITNSNDRVVVYIENDEERNGQGQVWLRDAKYEIFVDQPVGRLVGELLSVSGEVLGRGYYDLARLPKLAVRTPRVDQIPMTIAPVPRGISGSVLTAAIASPTNPKAKVAPVKNALVQLGQLPFNTLSQLDGRFTEDSLVEGSTILTHVDRPGHWGTLAFASVGSEVELPMFTDQAMRTLMMAATGADHGNERSSLVWGRVTRNGKPVAGARVDLMTTEKDVHPIYFNTLMLPDPSLKETSANGLYAFFPIEPGAHAVQAGDAHGVTEPALFPTDEKTATVMNLELSINRASKLRVFDAFKTDWPLSAEVVSSGRKRGALVPKSGELNATFTGGQALLVLDADAGPSYDRVRVMVSKSQKKIDFPMVQSVWLDRVRGAVRANTDPTSGTVVGLIRGTEAYQVTLEEDSVGANTKIVYFDSRGEVTDAKFGVRGGGFIILNMPSGFRTVMIQPSGSSKALAQAILVESRVTNVISKSF